MRCTNHNVLWTAKHFCGSNIVDYLRVWAVDHMVIVFLILAAIVALLAFIDRKCNHKPPQNEAIGYLRQIALHMSDVKDRM